MAEQMTTMATGWAVVNGRKGVARAVPVRSGALREASSGRVVTLSQVWAVAEAPTVAPVPVKPAEPELAFYRKYTEALLKRYGQLKLESGRAPSLLGREMFRGRVTHCRVTGFDDVVHFCLDVERCLAVLERDDQRLLRRIAVQEYTQGEAAMAMGMSLRGCILRYGRALDELTSLLLDRRLLEPQKGCQ